MPRERSSVLPYAGTLTHKQGAATRLTTVKAYDYLNRLNSVTATSSGASQPVFGSAYVYNAANQRNQQTLGDGSYWGRGRDRGFPRPPAQIRAGRITALGSYLEYERRTDPKAKDDRFVRLAAIVRHVVSSDPTSSASSGSVAEAIGTTSESLPCGTG